MKMIQRYIAKHVMMATFLVFIIVFILSFIINLLGERLEEWYGIYFPELLLDDKVKYAQVTLGFTKAEPDDKGLAKIIGQKKAEEVIERSKQSLGANLTDRDLSECRALAENILLLSKLRKQYDKYQEELAKELCPNISEVAGANLAAKLITHVGSLARLAILPASTIQVIGAEKALFKHLRNRRIAPPKHGLIFQHPKISSSPKDIRGKIARALSNKIALAAKADAFTKNQLGAKLKKDFDERYDEIVKMRGASGAK